MTKRQYREDLNILKGFAIIAVVFYHMGICTSGYLGVDAFFVISGFLVVPKVVNDIAEGRFSYFNFLEKRVVRLLPLLLLVSIACLIAGYYVMLPDDYENLNESIIASNMFSNNILAAITTKNYWNGGNAFKPLMHTWYVGILMEFYVVFPLIILAIRKCSLAFRLNFEKATMFSLVVLTIASCCSYIISKGGGQFYYLNNRFYELSLGAIVGLILSRDNNTFLNNYSISKWVSTISFVLLCFLIFLGVTPLQLNEGVEYNIVSASPHTGHSLLPKEFALISVVILTSIFVLFNNEDNQIIRSINKLRLFGWLGVMSYSIFIWHQPLLAFYRYTIDSTITPLFVIAFLLVTLVISVLSYYLIEKKIKVTNLFRWVTLLLFLLINAAAFNFYLNAGVVRDVPELNVSKDNVKRGQFSEYCDRVYSFDKEFSKENVNKPNVLVVGVSFARDWANILLESDLKDSINLSYVYVMREEYMKRISEADIIFYFDWKHNIPDYFWKSVNNNCEVYGIGTKSFGSCNGIIYKNRNRANYFDQTVEIDENFFLVNDLLKNEWGEKYIDMLTPVVQKDGTIKVFSDDHKFLSQDCEHLTQGGAKYYAKILNLNQYFERQ